MPKDKIARTAHLVGLCPLIPIPFMDEWIATRLRRKLYTDLAAEAGEQLTPEALSILEKQHTSWLVGCMVAPFKYVVKKLFRTTFFFLMLKDCVDWGTMVVHRAQMVRLALEEGDLPHGARYVREAMDRALHDHRPSPILRLITNQPRPDTASIGEPGPLAQIADRLHRWGGGGLVLVSFEGHLFTARRALNALAGIGPVEE